MNRLYKQIDTQDNIINLLENLSFFDMEDTLLINQLEIITYEIIRKIATDQEIIKQQVVY